MMHELYTMDAPSSWAAQPKLWSNTTLNGVDECPRRWQLSRSAWGSFSRFPERYHPAALEGIIVHEGLDLLSRACGRHGRPRIGTKQFQEALADSGFFRFFTEALADWNGKLQSHPRHGPYFTLKAGPQELANRSIRLFREQYRPTDDSSGADHTAKSRNAADTEALEVRLEKRGLLSEVDLEHPSLAFMGKIDRVQLSSGAVEIVDFKSGVPKPSHRTQLECYALLWWRVTGVAPAQATAQYLDTRTSWQLADHDLERAESELSQSIDTASSLLVARPAVARPGAACRYCPVRARCPEGWASLDTGKVTNGIFDIELQVMTEPGPTGFLAKSRGDHEVNVVHHAALGSLLPTLSVGNVVRVVAGSGAEKSGDVEIKAWTEVYLVAGTQNGGRHD